MSARPMSSANSASVPVLSGTMASAAASLVGQPDALGPTVNRVGLQRQIAGRHRAVGQIGHALLGYMRPREVSPVLRASRSRHNGRIWSE